MTIVKTIVLTGHCHLWWMGDHDGVKRLTCALTTEQAWCLNMQLS